MKLLNLPSACTALGAGEQPGSTASVLRGAEDAVVQEWDGTEALSVFSQPGIGPGAAVGENQPSGSERFSGV